MGELQTTDEQQQLVTAAASGDRGAYDRLAAPHVGRLRSLTYRMVGHPEDAADLVQDALLRGFASIGDFRGEANFGTWLFTIATRLSLNHLRARKRWRWQAQTDLPTVARHAVHDDPASPVHSDPDFVFNAREHIAFCFTCVARSLPPEQEAALVLRDVFDFSNAEAAKILGVSHSVLRHHLAKARKHMQTSFDGLCAIVNKEGMCHQCSGLRRAMPEQRQGPAVPTLGDADAPREQRYRHRLTVVREADLETGQSAGLHAMLYRRLAELEARVH